MNLSGFKKLKETKEMVTMGHPAGHEIKIAKKQLSALQRKQIERLPIHMANGGDPIDDEEVMNSTPPKSEIEADAPSYTGPMADPAANSPAPASIPIKGEMAPSTSMDLGAAQSPINVNAAFQQGQEAIKEQQKVNQQLAAQKSGIEQQYINDKNDLDTNGKQILQDFAQHKNDFDQYIRSNPIDPKHYQENMGAGQKVATAIGLLLGGFSGGFNKTGVNPASEWLNKQIERDIEGQRGRMDQQKTILGANQELYRDQVLANNAARINMNDLYSHQIQQAADKLGTPQAKAAADAELSNRALQNSQLLEQSARRATALKAAANPNFNSPEILVPALVPAEHQKEALKEAGQSKAASNSKEFLLAQFDKAAKENTVLRTGAGIARTPPSIQSMNALELPLIHDQEGRVNEFEQKTLQGLHPQPGDLDSKILKKRAAYEQFLANKQETPTLNAFIPGWGARQQAARPIETKVVNGVTYRRGANGEAVPVK